MNSARLSATKWYLLVTETDTNAITAYTAALVARGLSLTNRTDNAAGDYVTLGDASFQVLLEEMSLPGQGVTIGAS